MSGAFESTVIEVQKSSSEHLLYTFNNCHAHTVRAWIFYFYTYSTHNF